MVGADEINQKGIKVEKAKNFVSTISTVLKDVSNVAKGVNTVLSINPYDFVTVDSQIMCRKESQLIKKELVLVFDDFERSKINKVDLLGAINDYSENSGIKVILIADEDHIQGEEYKEFKEKLVSRTVKLKADYTSVISAIIDGYKESVQGYQSFLKKNIDSITLVFLESQTENLRSFKAFLLDFERVYQIWIDSCIPDNPMSNVLYSFGAVLFEFKSNNYKEHEKYGYLFAEGEIKKKYTKWKGEFFLNSLRKWITDGDWNKQEIIKEINYRFKTIEKTPEQLFLYHEFWDLTQETVAEGLAIALQRAYEGKLGRDELMHLLQRSYMLKEYGIIAPVDIDYDRLSYGLDIREEMMKRGEITDDPCGTFILGEVLQKIPVEAQALYYRIEKMEERCEAWNSRRSFIECINGNNALFKKLEHQYLISFDEELLDLFYNAYKTARNGQKRDLILVLRNFIYNDKRVSTDLDIQVTISNLQKLKMMLKQLLDSEQDAIARVNISETRKVVSELLQMLEGAE